MFRRISTGLLLAFASSAPAVAAPFTNGSFEQSADSDIGVYTTIGPGSHELPGWHIPSRNVDHIGSYWDAAHGSRSLDLNGNLGDAMITQRFDTLSDVDYLVRFAVAGNPFGGALTKSVLVGWVSFGFDGATLSEHRSVDFTHPPNPGPSNMGWTYHEFVFRSENPFANLYFISLSSDPRYGPALDDVSVTAIATAEPSSLVLLCSGVAGVVCRRFRREPRVCAPRAGCPDRSSL